MSNGPPKDWNDRDAWDRHFEAELSEGRILADPDPIIRRFLSYAREKGGRIWFPGCGLDLYPKTYAEQGCRVLATDFSSVAVRVQQHLAEAFLGHKDSTRTEGTFDVLEHDFTQNPPGGEFDLVINCRAFQGLSPTAMRAAAGNFHAALRVGGACIIDTINVQGNDRNLIEDSLVFAGFYLPFLESQRRFQAQLDSTGIIYEMVLGRPLIPARDQYPPERFEQFRERDQEILDSLQDEFERECQEEADKVKDVVNDPATIVAHVVYATG